MVGGRGQGPGTSQADWTSSRVRNCCPQTTQRKPPLVLAAPQFGQNAGTRSGPVDGGGEPARMAGRGYESAFKKCGSTAKASPTPSRSITERLSASTKEMGE